MSTFTSNAKDTPTHAGVRVVHQQKGFIAYCETTQRYEGGRKAWLFLGPYFFGAYIIYATINEGHGEPQKRFLPWLGFIAYLVLFPSAWKWVVGLFAPKRTHQPQSFEGADTPLTAEIDEKTNPFQPTNEKFPESHRSQ